MFAFVCLLQPAGALQAPQVPGAVGGGAGAAAQQPAGEPAGLPHHHARRESRAPHELHGQRPGRPRPLPRPLPARRSPAECLIAAPFFPTFFPAELLQGEEEGGHLHPVSSKLFLSNC